MQLSDAAVDALFAEDVPYGDLTTNALGIGGRRGRITMAARGEMVVCCVEEAERLLRRQGADTARLAASGDRVPAGDVFLTAEAPAAVLHGAWRVAQNLIEHASGIATTTRRLVDTATAIAPDIVIECTRKHLPGARGMAARAVTAGGGKMHRLGLSESILIFPQHVAFLPPGSGFVDAIGRLKRQYPGKKVTVEAWSLDEGVRLADAGVDIIQLDKLPPSDVRAVVERTRSLTPAPAIAAAGGVNGRNAAEYAATGCHILVTSAPYFAPPMDVKITIGPA
jgi:putative molybdenum utilization protein ModD